ncbi:MAG: HAD family hydrolase [Desulfovibrio sp.]|jgi:phosphoglycolate phosphatase|nr:HAD family hydrolase [Desulfovibrio sp.]
MSQSAQDPCETFYAADPALFRKGRGLAAVLFDFDGTLAVPTLDFALMRARTLEALAPFAREPFRPEAMIMEELDRVTALLPPAGAKEARLAAFAAIEAVELEAASRSSLFPFVRPMLAALRRKNIPFGVITRNFPSAVFTVFPDLGQYSPCILTREDVPRVKPDPDHLERAFRRLGVRPGATLMVGDHPSDIQTGRRAGSRTAGVDSGEASRDRLAGEFPDFLAADAGELMRGLEILGKY